MISILLNAIKVIFHNFIDIDYNNMEVQAVQGVYCVDTKKINF